MDVLPNRAPGGRDALIVTFREAKVSVLQWDGDRHQLSVTGLHYFEGDESLKAGRKVFPYPPSVVTDPQGRCAAVILLRHQLAVLPAMESEEAILGVVMGEGEGDEVAKGAIGNSYVDNLAKMGVRDVGLFIFSVSFKTAIILLTYQPGNSISISKSIQVMDAVFLHGYAEPVLMILHETDPTWAGNLRSKKDTCQITALSLNLTAKRHPKIWSVSNVPSDAFRLSAAPCGGVLVFTTAMVLYYTQGHQSGVVVNSVVLPPPLPPPPLQFNPQIEAPNVTASKYGQEHPFDVYPDTAPEALKYCDSTSFSGLKLALDGCHCVWLDVTTALLGLRSGQLVLLQLSERITGATGRSISLSVTGVAPVASCLAVFPSSKALKEEARKVFLGSVVGDSLLLEAAFGGGSRNSSNGVTREENREDGREAKRVKTEYDETKKEIEVNEDLALYGLDSFDLTSDDGGSSKGTTTSTSLKCRLRVLDTFLGIGPCTSLVLGPTPSSRSNASPYVLACCGKEKSGALVILRQNILPEGSWRWPVQRDNIDIYVLFMFLQTPPAAHCPLDMIKTNRLR